jgi:hypothetical protein
VHEKELPDDLIRFIHASVPSIDALEMLLFVVRQSGERCTVAQVNDAMRGSVEESAVVSYLAQLVAQGVLTGSPANGYAYADAAPAITHVIDRLVRAYNERPVTLIRTVYQVADSNSIQRFADAFKFRKDR